MKKMKPPLASNRGFTLVEMVITVALSAIILAGTALLLIPTMNVYAKANELAEMNGLCNNLLEELSGEIERIDQPPVIDAANHTLTLSHGSTVVQYSLADGILYKKADAGAAAPFLPAKAYKGKVVTQLAFIYEPQAAAQAAIITVDLELTASSGGALNRQLLVRPLILNQTLGGA